jgi:hypothetical protein
MFEENPEPSYCFSLGLKPYQYLELHGASYYLFLPSALLQTGCDELTVKQRAEASYTR